MLTEVDSADHSGILILNSAFRGWFRSSRSSNNRNVYCDGQARGALSRDVRGDVFVDVASLSDLRPSPYSPISYFS